MRTTAVTEPEHARAPTSEQWIKNITYLIAAKNTRVPEFSVFGSTDMHEEKNIDTVIQSICRLRGTGQVELFREVLQFMPHLSVVFRMHWFGVDQGRRATGCQDRDDCSEEFTVGELDDRLVNDSETINRQCELVVLHSADRRFLE